MIKKLPLASAIAMALALPAQAVEFDLGRYNVRVDSTLSIGATMRTEDPDMRVIHPGNMAGGEGQSGVADDGNLNFEKGDLTSLVFRGIHDVAVDGGNHGFFVRFNYWYDDILKNENVYHGHAATNYYPDARLNTNAFDDYSAGSGLNLLDAFFYTGFDLGQMPVDLRIGRQVLSWGESTFIQNGINSINPADVNAVRRPGAEVREALLPIGMVSASIGLNAGWSLDAFTAFEWDNTKLDGCGSFFSTVDIIGGPGCDKVTLNPQIAPGRFLSDQESVEAGAYITRAADRDASDSGQYGLAARYYSTALDTEFGFFFINVHNTQPIISAYDWDTLAWDTATETAPSGWQTGDISTANVAAIGPQYFVEWPEDNQIFGTSFSTTLGAWSWSGEVSYRPNQAVQINTTEILTAGLQPAAPSSFRSRITEARGGDVDAPVGAYARGYEELEVYQAQMTFVNFFDRLWGSQRMTFIGEVGANYVADLPGLDEQRFGRNPVYGKCLTSQDQATIAQLQGNPGASAGDFNDQNCEGFVTDLSFGYRARFVFEYANVYKGWNLNPTLVFNHDVHGYSPNPNFIEGRVNVGLLMDASYQSKYRLSLAYNHYTGADYDPAQDRNHVGVNFAYSF
ncbi:DUF1302 domain-containing protein [Aliidiomarina soli]|uniref:DUF1302 domain-containing protein n=1 Tax=Aliidiomarina soli TaxID=1928574 RepID=A0A432WC90_9GAMM|nr:DUF1302 domain-containing protein [Aliidiomarina soli]RUO29663.1 DUF1302 domain-containing protein [Aliidiomarina soli]